MEVRILGPVEAAADDGVVSVRGVRLRALLARLALEPGRPVTVSALAASLWADESIGDEANAIQSLVSRLRRMLPDPAAIDSIPGGYRLAAGPEDVDAGRFARLARTGRERLAAGDPTAAAEALQQGLDLWRGAPLADVGDAPYADAEAARLTELRLSAEEDLLAARLALGQAADVVHQAEALAAEHPLRERSHALHLRALQAVGRQAEALAAYENVRRTLADELGVDPSAELRELHQSLLRGDAGPRPRAVAEATGHQSHAPLTSFIGREAEMAALEVRLAEHRLVTLVGPGGAGKTRLAAETAARVAEAYPGGTWFATLAPLDEPRDLAQAVVGMLGLRDRTFGSTAASPAGGPAAARDPGARLAEALGNAPAMLVLDNCEHLVEAAAELAEQLLSACPQLHLLATSREPLGIVGEELAPVLPLDRPEPGSSPEQALQTASARLFAERAAAVSPGFEVDESSVESVVEICRRLDGLPLAIELAAARLRTMGVGQVAARLDDRFRLLTGGSRTALPRHRTLRAVVAWSWDLLDQDERSLAEAVAVFPGGVTPDSASAVTAHPAEDVFDLLTALVEKSLLQVADPEEPRYRMLETLREYGVEQLAASDDLAAARRAHGRWAVRAAERADPRIVGRDQLPWIRLLSAERDNFSAALRYAVDTEDVDTASRLTAALSALWMLQSNHDEGLAWARAVLALPGTGPPVAHAVVLAVRDFSFAMMDFGNTEELEQGPLTAADVAELEKAVAAAGGLNAHRILAFARPILAMARRDDAEAVRLLEEGIGTTTDAWARATLTFLRGMIMQNKGDQAALERDLVSAREQYTAIGDRWGWAMTELASADLHRFSDEVDLAIEELSSAAGLMREIGATEDMLQALVQLAVLQAQTGHPDDAEATLAAATDAAGQSPLPRLRASLAIGRAGVAIEVGDLETAEVLLRESLRGTGESIGGMYYEAAAMTILGYLAARGGDLVEAREQMRQAYRRAIHVQDMPIIAMVVVGWGYVRAIEGAAAEAARLLGLAAVIRGVDDRGPGITRFAHDVAVVSIGEDEVDRIMGETRFVAHPAALEEADQLIGGAAWSP